jgi:hypothetical protein
LVLTVLLVVVIVRILAVRLGLALMAVAIIVLASLRMSGHRAGRLELRCRNCVELSTNCRCAGAGLRLKHCVSQARRRGVRTSNNGH